MISVRSEIYEKSLDEMCQEIVKPENREGLKAMLVQYDSLVKQANNQVNLDKPFWCYGFCKNEEEKEIQEITMRPMELKDTAELMNSEDYKECFKAEYGQVAIRLEKLKKMVEDWDAGTLKFRSTCPRSLYDMQIRAMKDYATVLEARAVMEGVIL